MHIDIKGIEIGTKIHLICTPDLAKNFFQGANQGDLTLQPTVLRPL